MAVKRKMAHDPGGRIRLALKDGVMGDATFGGANEEYRYRLERVWDATKPSVLFVLMNPSTADPMTDDPTVAKCCRFARSWGYGGILIANTFAYRATDQDRLTEILDPIGPYNDSYIIAMAKKAAVVVFAYGKPRHRSLRARGMELVSLLLEHTNVKLHILRLAKDGTPCHPLYLPASLKPIVWKP